MSSADHDSVGRDRLTATWVELAIRLGVLGLLLFFSFTLIRPFITIAIWSVVLTVALYPVYDWMAGRLGGSRRLAALLLTILNLLIVIGPATWLTLGLIDSIRNLSEHLDLSALTLPPPPHAVKTWPIIGASIYQFWDLASTNFQAALAKTAPLLKPLGGILLGFAEGAGIGVIKFFIAIVLAGFLFSPAPSLVNAILLFSRRLASGRGEKFVQLAGATIRAVSRGVIGVSALQAFLAGVGLVAAGIPGAKFVPLDSRNHVFLADEPATRVFFDAVTSFLGDPPFRGRYQGPQPSRSERGDTLQHSSEVGSSRRLRSSPRSQAP